MRPRVAAFLFGPWCLAAPAVAAELPDAEVHVTRSDAAKACPDDAALVEAITQQGAAAPAPSPDGRVLVDIAVTRDDAAFVATLRVDGRLHGERVLRGEGPTCDTLREALVLALLVLLDRVPAAAPPPPIEAPPSPSPAPDATPSLVPVPAPPPVQAVEPPHPSHPSHPSQVTVALDLGAALTFGQPVSAFVAVHAGAAVLVGPWEIGFAGQWSPPRGVESGPGSVEVQAWGFVSRLCREITSRRALQWSGCALGSLFVLSGEGQGLDDARFTARPWWRAGLGMQAVVPLAPRLQLAIFGNGFITLHPEAFSVAGLGERYHTSLVTGELGTALRIPLN